MGSLKEGRFHNDPSPLLLGAALVGCLYLFGKLVDDITDRYRQGDSTGDLAYDQHAMGELRQEGLPPCSGRLLRWLGHATSTKTLTPATVSAVLALLPRHSRAALFLAMSSLGTLTLQRLAKGAIRRPRPEERRGESGTSSFPSGHGAETTAIALASTLIARREFPRVRGIVGTVSLSLAVLVGASRPLLRQHYPSDVLAGDALGVACVLAAYLWYRK